MFPYTPNYNFPHSSYQDFSQSDYCFGKFRENFSSCSKKFSHSSNTLVGPIFDSSFLSLITSTSRDIIMFWIDGKKNRYPFPGAYPTCTAFVALGNIFMNRGAFGIWINSFHPNTRMNQVFQLIFQITSYGLFTENFEMMYKFGSE